MTLKLASFAIKTPADGGDYQLSLGRRSVSAHNLKYGVVKLFKDLGIYEMPAIMKAVGASPESYGRKLLLNILDNGSPHDTAAEPPGASPVILNSPDIRPSIHPDSLPVVTLNSVPVKPRNHIRTQLTLEDPFIIEAINHALETGKDPRERSYRFIAGELGKQGIRVSHMTISRRIKGLVKETYAESKV